MSKLPDHKTIYLVRHAQTKGNFKGNWLGARSIDELNEYGRKQARFTAEYLLERNVNASKIFSSPTPRALQHAEILQKRLDLPIEKLNSLTEINLGILEDRTRDEGLRLVPEEVHDWHTNLTRFEPPLGESAIEAAERFYEIVELITKNYQKPDLIFVSHGVVIKLFLARILKSSIETAETKIKVPWTTHGTITIAGYEKQGFRFQRVVQNKYPDSERIAAFG
ncbi:histidine phosphatase family protein [Candidatus Dojkabacteria bacterium]|nr:histidine phosphatase family protein [Candidatus Dojkabacteria bacterium]